MDPTRAMKFTAFAGLGLMIVGGVLVYRQWSAPLPGTPGAPNNPSPLSGRLRGLGRGLADRHKPMFRGFVDQAPVVSSYSDGNMATQLRESVDMPIEQRLATIQDLVHKSVQDPEMRKLALQLTANCPARDGMCEAKAIYKAVKDRIRYTGDVAPIQMPDGTVDGIDLYQSARRTWFDMKGGDCLPKGTLVLVEGHKFVAIEDVIIGQRIWGRDRWTTVKDLWFKGLLPVDAIHLNNGSTFKATSEHKVYVAICPRHEASRASGPCSCPISERSIERLLVSQLEPGMVLIQPDKIDFGTEKMDPRRAYVEGLYLSDGFSSHPNDFAISGQDGCPKEAQKREVQEICAALGIETTWQRKHIAIKDKEWAQRLQQMGTRAALKTAQTINWDEPAVRELLRGIMADSGANTHGEGRTFTSTSRMLTLQTRVLHRMLGISCSERYIVDHGGLGENPIHRLGVRSEHPGKGIKLLRVKEIDRGVMTVPTYDISTEDHYVYLPEADVVVSNCDDMSILIATLLSLNGITARLRVMKEDPNEDWSHIYPVALLPKNAPASAVALDATLPGRNKFGVEAPAAQTLDFAA